MKTLKTVPLLLLLICLLSSFGGEEKTFKSTDWIPEDFDARKSVLLVEVIDLRVYPKVNEKLNVKAKEIMEELYPYKYEFAEGSVIEEVGGNGKYEDKDKYRWALMYTSGSKTMGQYGGSGGMTVNSSDFHLYDRLNDKHGKNTGNSNSYIQNVMRPTVATITKYLKDKGN